MKRFFWFFAVLVAGCPGARTAPPLIVPPAPVPVRVLLTVQSASIDGKKADGAPWDDPATPAVSAPAGGPLATYLGAHPEMDGTEKLLGEPVLTPGLVESSRKSSAADPMVLVEVDPLVFRTPVAASQFQPVWRFPIVLWLVPGGSQIVRLTVVDFDGAGQYDVVGTRDVPAADLLAGKPIELTRFGNVERLSVEAIVPAPIPTSERRVSVAARVPWTETGIDVVAGQEVWIRATGDVCSEGDDPKHCAGPEGQAAAEDDNAPGFADKRHAALIGAIGDTRFLIGRERRFVAASSGPLLLGLNDATSKDNSGELEVEVDLK